MRISVDRERCEGHGICEAAAPLVFQLDDDGELDFRFEQRELPAEQSEQATLAVHSCPVAALTIQQHP